MDEEERDAAPQGNLEPVGAAAGSDDDDGPISLFLKMKKSQKPKEEKLGSDEGKAKKAMRKVSKPALMDGEFGGMEDTLACLRKKLRGPKKDTKLTTGMRNDSLAPAVQSEIDDSESASQALAVGYVINDEKPEAVSDSNLESKSKRNSKRHKTCSTAEMNSDLDIDGGRRERMPKKSSDVAAKVSLSASLRKRQSTSTKKSNLSLGSKQKMDVVTIKDHLKFSSGGSVPIPKHSVPVARTGEHMLVEATHPVSETHVPVSSPHEIKDGKNLEMKLKDQHSVSEVKTCSSLVTVNNVKLDSAEEVNVLVNGNQAGTAVVYGLPQVSDRDDERNFKSGEYVHEEMLASLVSPLNTEDIDLLDEKNLKVSTKINTERGKVAYEEPSGEEADRRSSQSLSPNQSDSTDAVSLLDLDNNKSQIQRAGRNTKKRRHWDMTYEGDADWDNLISDGNSNHKRHGGVKTRKSEKLGIFLESENGEAAAVTAGLKARKAGPIEKVKFKEVLKRKGGLQDYIECRNHIMGLWSKDIRRILLLSDCGITDVLSKDEHMHAPLIREVYHFLDQSGFINAGIAAEKEKSISMATDGNNFVKEKNFVKSSANSVAGVDDGVSFLVGGVEDHKVPMDVKAGSSVDDHMHASKYVKGLTPATPAEESIIRTDCIDDSADAQQMEFVIHEKPPVRVLDSDHVKPDIHVEAMDQDLDPALEKASLPSNMVSTPVNNNEKNQQAVSCGSDARKKVLVIGAGAAGLSAARHLQRQGVLVTILEARSRIGGRVHTDRTSLSVPVDVGASIITGIEADMDTERRPDPSSLICSQLGLELTILNSDCPLYDTVTGQKVPADLDETLEDEYNSLLDDMVLLVAQNGQHAMKMSLEDGLEYVLRKRRQAQSGTESSLLPKSRGNCFDLSRADDDSESHVGKKFNDDILSPLERRVMNWHFAHLEYGCAALLKEVSLPYWNQDDVYGGFGGAHCMIKGGYSSVVESLADGLQIHLNQVVSNIVYNRKDSGETADDCSRAKVLTTNGCEFSADAVLVTVPLGCLKADSIKFEPPLPQWKHSSIQRLGYGVLDKVVLEFPDAFWDDSVDYFGATAEKTSQRGQCFMFWNLKKTVGAPVLIALLVGKAALDGQSMTSADHVNHAVETLRKLFGKDIVPDPVASVVTDWGRDPFSYGAYTYVAIGASGEDYDLLGRPVDNCLFFAGEATCKEHPDTVGGAMMSGIREAVRILDIFKTGSDNTAEVEAIEAAQRHSDSERDEVRDIKKRFEAVDLSNALYDSSFDGTRILTRKALLRDLFVNVKTTAGRLHLAKELLTLPVEALRSFAGTKQGLTTLNSWMLDSMGKDGTQLLRHCVRILVLVSTNLLAVRLSGIGKTVKDKVCVHTSRDIRAIASQLVSVWLDIFRKEKASNGGSKLLRLTAKSSKSKSLKVMVPGKPPLRTHRGTPEVTSAGNRTHSNSNSKKLNSKIKNSENESKSDMYSSRSGSSTVKLDAKEEEANYVMTEEEQASLAAAEAARAAAHAAAEAYASSSVKSSVPLPKIPSFHKFARREQYAQMDESEFRKKWSGGALGRQDCYAESDSRNCRVRDWSLDFSAACPNIDSSAVSVDKQEQHSQSNDEAYQMNFREHSGESAAPDRSLFTKAWVDGVGSDGLKDYHAIERWQSQAAEADANYYQQMLHEKYEADSNATSKSAPTKHGQVANESSISQLTTNKHLENMPKGVDHLKQAVVDYVASLLMPLYKARKIDRDGYKNIMKKTATKVMEQTSDAEKAISVYDFLDYKRKNKIRAFVDTLIERHITAKAAGNH